MSSLVRGVLWRHIQARSDAYLGPADALDPNTLVPAEGLAEALRTTERRRGEDAIRELAHDYVAMWARTFKTLVRHLRGRPERALRLFCDEVYPFLRGERRAARIESLEPRRARVLLAADLPPAYLAGLLEAFVGLSRAQARAHRLGHEVFEVTWQVAPTDRLYRAIQHAAAMRVPYLLAMAWAAATGILLALPESGYAWWRAGATFVGAVAVQGGANAFHDLRTAAARGPLGPNSPTRRWLWSIVALGYGSAAAIAAALAWTGTPLIFAYGAVGLVLSLLYARFRDQGLGPVVAGFTYGPFVVTGAVWAMVGWPGEAAFVEAFWVSVPLGALAAAFLYLNDLADRPLDEASGRRTLLVRLPRPQHVAGYAVLLAVGIGALLALVWSQQPWLFVLPYMVAVALALVLVRDVGRHVDDPHGLTWARFGTLTLHGVVGLVLIARILEALP